MKIEQAEKTFRPITFTIESMEELVILAAGVGSISANDVERVSHRTFEIDIDVDSSPLVKIYNALHEKIKEYQ